MKKVLLLTAAIALLAAPAMAGIKTSRHNLGTTGDYVYRATSAVTQICVFCHTPHNPVKNVPLWNRNDPGNTTFLLYTGSATISASNKIASIDANAISLFCLSCHDGSNGLWALVRNGGIEAGASPGGRLSIRATRTNIGAGQNLTNDHPINVRLGSARNDTNDVSTNWNSDAYVIGTGRLRLFRIGANSDYVECASCHDPHNTDNTKFLRKNNSSSSLCLTCHNK